MAKTESENIQPGWPVLASNAWWAIRRTWSASPGLCAGVLVTSMVNAVIPASMAVLFGLLVGAVKDAMADPQPDLSRVLLWVGVVAGLMLLTGLGGVIQRYCRQRLTDELNLKISQDALDHAIKLDLAFFEDSKSQDILQRATQHSGRNFFEFVMGSIGAVSLAVQFVSLLGVLLWIEPLVTSLLAVLAVPWMIFRWHMAKVRYAAERSKTTKRRWSRYYSARMTSRNFVPIVKLLDLGSLLSQRFEQAMRHIMEVDRRIYLKQAIGGGVAAFGFTAGLIVVVGWVGYRALNGPISFEMLVAYWAAAGRFRGCLTDLVNTVADSMERTLFITNLLEFVQVRPKITDRPDSIAPILKGEIEFQDVHFQYPGTDRNVIDGVSLHIRPGETVALVGPNGAGKTTLAKLIARLYEVSEGAILFDGHDVRDLTVRSVHDRIAYVGQNPVPFEATVHENIAYGDWRRLLDRPDQVNRIATEANLDSMIQDMPDGIDTMLGRMFGDYDLSGGQWQKIALGRALARDASIFILDEPTASLDVQSEYEMFDGFKRLARDRTTILISHRFSTVNMADRIFVMDEGRIAEQGTHDELISLGGIYASLYHLHESLLGIPQTTDGAGP